MDKKRRSNLAGGIVLVLLGVWFLLTQLVPGLELRIFGNEGWPLIIVSVGVLLLIIGLLTGVPEMAVPACIVGGVGGLLYWQNATNNWESWAYAWTLISGFAGVGGILSGIIGGKRGEISGGAWLVFISLVMFAIFSSFLGGPNLFGDYWPVLLIVLGLGILVRGMFGKKK